MGKARKGVARRGTGTCRIVVMSLMCGLQCSLFLQHQDVSSISDIISTLQYDIHALKVKLGTKKVQGLDYNMSFISAVCLCYNVMCYLCSLQLKCMIILVSYLPGFITCFMKSGIAIKAREQGYDHVLSVFPTAKMLADRDYYTEEGQLLISTREDLLQLFSHIPLQE